ncbi:MFS transporter [Streptomyces sp. NA04227]|uniref:MFS transporter n=1 Tax=Streptomyces sp. NA04227 TaxID=2742136 RepID=UPI0015915475|nr:MFS transporter [Streptomyces sp. NA04227]QKW05583.1 MFS transporter [Streptomyces sp. NA04227]
MTLRHPARAYLTAVAGARTGDEMAGPALLLTALAVTGSAATASGMLAALTVASALGGPVLGVLLDRARLPGRLLALVLTAHALCLLLLLAALGRVPLPWCALIAVTAGLLGPALSGGWTAQLPRLVPPDTLARATAGDAMTFNLAALAGPALAGCAAAAAGAPYAVLLAAALICAAVPTAWGFPARERTAVVRGSTVDGRGEVAGGRTPPGRARTAASPAAGSTRDLVVGLATELAADLAAGFRAVAVSPPLARATAASVLSCAGEGAFVACTPLLGAAVLGAESHGALLLSGMALAALGSNALFARRGRGVRPERVMVCAPLVLAVACLLAAVTEPALLLLAVVLAGAAEGPQLTALFAIRHREAPEALRGQIFTTGASLKLTGYAAGAALAGLTTVHSLTAALLAAAGFQVLAAAAASRTSSCRRS